MNTPTLNNPDVSFSALNLKKLVIYKQTFPSRYFSVLPCLEELVFVMSSTDSSKLNLPESLISLHFNNCLPFSNIGNSKILKSFKEFHIVQTGDVPMILLRNIPSATKIFSFNNHPKTPHKFDLSLIPDSAKHVALTLPRCPYQGIFSEKLIYLSLDLHGYPIPFVEFYKQYKIGHLPNLLTFVVLIPSFVEHDLRDHIQTPAKVPSKCIRIYEIPERISEFLITRPTDDPYGNVKVIASGDLSVEDLKRRVLTPSWPSDPGLEFL
ncbi:unnamed protein product [Ambrosiozyma monospora]|uniref:Unnamed protein product n=1 Tax=Ambrosiozyma monospora TaxID=43982 RepID=A0ACB5TNS8_AMBMO|nr:unnamed protein product [Ambrosiozyma monospora]